MGATNPERGAGRHPEPERGGVARNERGRVKGDVDLDGVTGHECSPASRLSTWRRATRQRSRAPSLIRRGVGAYANHAHPLQTTGSARRVTLRRVVPVEQIQTLLPDTAPYLDGVADLECLVGVRVEGWPFG